MFSPHSLPLRKSHSIQPWVEADSPIGQVLRALPVPTSCRETGEAGVNLTSTTPLTSIPQDLMIQSCLPQILDWSSSPIETGT